MFAIREIRMWGFGMNEIGKRVKALRISKRLTQTELADKMGIKQPSLAAIESGKTKTLKGETLEALARELSSTTSYILRGSQSSDDHEHSMLQAEMIAIFRDLPLSDKETLLRMARGILPAKNAKISAKS